MDFNLEEDLGGLLTEESSVFGKSVEDLSDSEDNALMDELGNIETRRKAYEMLEIMKAATPVGKGTEHPGEAREGWHVMKTTDGYSLVNDVPYIGELVFGSAPHIILANINSDPFSGGKMKPMSWLQEGSRVFATTVHHPGANPVKDLRAAWDDAYVHGLVTEAELRRDFTDLISHTGIF